jgi:hypothetical protein
MWKLGDININITYNSVWEIEAAQFHWNQTFILDSQRLFLFAVLGALNLGAYKEPVFVNILRSPGINSQPGGLVRQPYLTYQPAKLHRLKLINKFGL